VGGLGKYVTCQIFEVLFLSFFFAFFAIHIYDRRLFTALFITYTLSFAPPSTFTTASEYQLRLGKQGQVWFIRSVNERGVCK